MEIVKFDNRELRLLDKESLLNYFEETFGDSKLPENYWWCWMLREDNIRPIFVKVDVGRRILFTVFTRGKVEYHIPREMCTYICGFKDPQIIGQIGCKTVTFMSEIKHNYNATLEAFKN